MRDTEKRDAEKLEQLERMEYAALRAAAHLVQAAETKRVITVQSKADRTIVMNLDLECQAILLEELAGSLTIVAEEDASSHRHIGKTDDYLLVDPIDGTTSCKRFLAQRGGQVGFGPLLGLVLGGRLSAAVFYNVPARTLYSAASGIGSFALATEPGTASSKLPTLTGRRLLRPVALKLRESGLLFFPGGRTELQLIELFKRKALVENVYRFGGFANDCSRLAEGYEQLQLQLRVRAWDLPGALIPQQAGLSVLMNPLQTAAELPDWTVAAENPLMIGSGEALRELLAQVKAEVPGQC